jgi:hypothetical protein
MKVLRVSLCLLFLSFFIKVDDSWAVDYLSPNIESCAGSNAYMMTTIPFSTTAKSIQVKSHSSLSTNVRKIYYQIFNDQGENLLDSTKKLADSSIYEGSGAGGGIEDLTEIVDTGKSFVNDSLTGFNSIETDGSLLSESYVFGEKPNENFGRLLLPRGEQSIFENTEFSEIPIDYPSNLFEPNKDYIYHLTAYNYKNELDKITNEKCIRSRNFLVTTDVADVKQISQSSDSIVVNVENFSSEVTDIEYNLCKDEQYNYLGTSWEKLSSGRYEEIAGSGDLQNLVAIGDNRTSIYTSSNSGSTFIKRLTPKTGTGIVMSIDGSKILASFKNSKLLVSSDSGASWVERESDRNWSAVASSSDGSKLVATVSGGNIYTSSDSGANWVERESDRNWSAVASSSDGSKLVATVSGGNIYTSSDSGASWELQYGKSLYDPNNALMAADGQKFLVSGMVSLFSYQKLNSLPSGYCSGWTNIGSLISNSITKEFTGLENSKFYNLNLRFKNNSDIILIKNQQARYYSAPQFNDGKGGLIGVTATEDPNSYPYVVTYQIATNGIVQGKNVFVNQSNFYDDYIKQFYIQSLDIKGDNLEFYSTNFNSDSTSGIFDFSGDLRDSDCQEPLGCGWREDLGETYEFPTRNYIPPTGYTNRFKPELRTTYTNGLLSGINFLIKGVDDNGNVLEGGLSPNTTFRLKFYVGKKIPNFIFTNAQIEDFSYEVGDGLNKLVTIEAKPIAKLSVDSDSECNSNIASSETLGVLKGDLVVGSENSPLKNVWIASNAVCRQLPTWNGSEIVVKVGGPHFRSNGAELNTGYFKAKISESTLAAWGTTQTQALNSGIQMLVDKTGLGSTTANISTIASSDGGVIITANDLTYSFPQLKIGKKVTSSGGGGGGGSPSRILPNLTVSGSPLVLPNPVKVKDSFFKSLDANQIRSISVSQFAKLPVKTIALLSQSQAKALTFDQLKALKPSQVVAMKPSVIAVLDSSQIAALQPADFKLMKTTQIARISAEAAAGLAKSDLNSFSRTQLRSLNTKAVKGLNSVVLKSLSINKLRQFSPRQIRSLTDEQKSVLTKIQKRALRIK